MNRVFDDFFRGFDQPLAPRGQLGWPHVEVRDNGKEYKVVAELPGLEQRE
jgi:HSP20 family molecular chaperone IbpA